MDLATAPIGAPDAAGVGDVVLAAVRSAAGGLGRARPDAVDADAAIGVVLAARWAQAAAVAVEVDAGPAGGVLPGGRAARAGL